MIPHALRLTPLFGILLLAACGQQAPVTTSTANTPTTSNPTAAAEDTTGGGIAEGTTLTPQADANSNKMTAQAHVNCASWTYKGSAQAICTITSGQARVRADCKWAPDLYSPWTGKGTWSMWTGECPWGIRSAIIETRH